jgi:hypothetical protein
VEHRALNMVPDHGLHVTWRLAMCCGMAALTATGCDGRGANAVLAGGRGEAVFAADTTASRGSTAAGTAAAERGGDPATATAPAAPDVPEFHPLRDARAGEWAMYQALEGRAIRYEVVEVGHKIKTRITVFADGKRVGEPAVREDPPDFDPLRRDAECPGVSRTIAPRTIRTAGREWEALLHEDRWVDEDEVHYVRRTWVSAQAPVFGIVRMELYGSTEPAETGDGELEARLELRALAPARVDQLRR